MQQMRGTTIVSVRRNGVVAVGGDGQVWWSSAAHPVSGMYPTAAWKPGEAIADWHEIPIPAADGRRWAGPGWPSCWSRPTF